MTTRHHVAYLVPHTHWDREWYLPFQVFRARLVDVIDHVLELLGSERYRRFTLDGQAVVLDDYLEVRPERRADVEAAVRSGRLRIGPWYVLADEFLVSPEALIRNLALGIETCRSFGGAMGVAYTPDSFGHVSQLPLVVRGFGLDAVVFERGVGDEGETLRGEFEWQCADGSTSVLAVHLLGTYSAAAGIGHVDWELRDEYRSERAVRQARAVLHGGEDLGPEFPQWLRVSIERLPNGIVPYATGQALLLLNGSDHLFPQPNVPDIVDDLNAAFDDTRFVHADLEEFVRAVAEQRAPLATHRGEFRGSRYHHVLPGVLSTRMYLKQANHACETLLERYVEPIITLAAARGAPDARALLRQAWRLLLVNHAHDSICGCSIDAVHREMGTRFEQVGQLGDDLVRRGLEALAGRRHDPREEPHGASHLALFNPSPAPHTAVVETDLLLPPGSAEALRVVDAAGAPLPVQLEVTPASAFGRADEARESVRLLMLAQLPPLAITSAHVAADGAGTAAPAAPAPAAPAVGRATGSGCRLENEHLRVEVDRDGAVTLRHRASERVHELALRFEDQADAGDEYDFSPVADDRPIVVARPSSPPRVAAEGPLRASVTIPYRLELPDRLDATRTGRVGTSTLAAVVTLVLDAAARRLDLVVEVDNTACDHRLRLLVATGCRSDTVWADGHFHVLERPVRPPRGDGWFQRPVPTSHQRRFVAIHGDGHGLALLNRGLPEYEAVPGDDGIDLAVTLLRCVGWLSRDDLASRPQGAGPALPTPEAQCLGRHRFELALVPFRGRWWEGPLPLEAERFIARPRAYRVHAPIDERLLTLTEPLTLSACSPSPSGGGAVVRVWNPAPERVRGRLGLQRPPVAAHTVRLDGTRLGALEITDDGIDLDMGGAEVVTLELVFAREEGEER